MAVQTRKRVERLKRYGNWKAVAHDPNLGLAEPIKAEVSAMGVLHGAGSDACEDKRGPKRDDARERWVRRRTELLTKALVVEEQLSWHGERVALARTDASREASAKAVRGYRASAVAFRAAVEGFGGEAAVAAIEAQLAAATTGGPHPRDAFERSLLAAKRRVLELNAAHGTSAKAFVGQVNALKTFLGTFKPSEEVFDFGKVAQAPYERGLQVTNHHTAEMQRHYDAAAHTHAALSAALAHSVKLRYDRTAPPAATSNGDARGGGGGQGLHGGSGAGGDGGDGGGQSQQAEAELVDLTA